MSLEQLQEAVANGKRKDAARIVTALLEGGGPPGDILDQGLIPAMAIVGERFRRGEAFVPEMLVAARAMKAGLELVEPRLLAAGIRPQFRAVIGTVEGDLHDIGKNLVATMWKGSGFEVFDLGVNVTTAQFLAAVEQHQPHVIGLSALLTTTMPSMTQTVRALREKGVTAKILVGGAPISEAFAREIGADGYARDAASAVEVARKILAA